MFHIQFDIYTVSMHLKHEIDLPFLNWSMIFGKQNGNDDFEHSDLKRFGVLFDLLSRCMPLLLFIVSTINYELILTFQII